MKETKENLLGYWFIEDIEYSGILSFSQEEGIFVTILSRKIGGLFNKKGKYPIITGIVQSGEVITLVNCQIFNSNMSSKNLSDNKMIYVEKAIIRAEYMIEGALYESVEKINFKSLLGRYTDLDEWVNLTGFDIERGKAENSDFDYVISFKSPKPKNFDINDDLAVGISFSIQGPKISMVQKEAKISQSCYLRITSLNKPMNISELLKYLRWFSLLLQIGTQRQTYPLEILGIIDKKNNPNLSYTKTVKIYFQPIEAFREEKPLIPPFLLFTFEDLNPLIIQNWFTNYSNLRTIINLRSTLFIHDRLFLETRFLNMLQALETLHNMTMKSRCIEKSTFSEIKDKIISVIPEKFKDLLIHKIGNLNYLSFRDKLIELFRTKESYFHIVVPNIDLFCKRVTKTRNMIVHPSNSDRPMSTHEIAYAIKLLKILFDAYILEQIGFSEKEVKTLTKKRIDNYLGWGIVFNR